MDKTDIAYTVLVVFLIVGSIILPLVATGTPNDGINWWGI